MFLLASCGSAEPAEPAAAVTVGSGDDSPEEAPEPVAAEMLASSEEPIVRRVVVDDPGLDPRYAETDQPPPAVRLRRIRSRRNQITDDERWLAEHDIAHLDARPTDAPATVGESTFIYSVVSQPATAVYGSRVGARHLWLAQDDGGAVILDLENLRTDGMEVADVRRVGDRVYLTRAHRSYASTTDGKNAYLVALDVTDGSVVWVTEPLTSNALAFTGDDRVLFTGYGFTAEPDHLYAIDRLTGRRLAELALRKGPTYLVLSDDELHVRTYDRDVTVRVTVTADAP